MILHKSKHINEVSKLKVDMWKQKHDEQNIFHEKVYYEHNLRAQYKLNILVAPSPMMIVMSRM